MSQDVLTPTTSPAATEIPPDAGPAPKDAPQTPETMRAAIMGRYGDLSAMSIASMPLPPLGPHDVLVRVTASTVNSGDYKLAMLDVPKGMGVLVRLALGWSKPRKPVMGMNFAGEIAAVGADVTTRRIGETVIGQAMTDFGAYAEYIRRPLKAPMVSVPDWMDASAALASVFGATTALHFLDDKMNIQAGARLLVIGASGAVGLAACQLGAHRGAEVHGVCSTPNAGLVRENGATHVIDYTHTSIDELIKTHAGQFDGVLDTVGQASLAQLRQLAKPDGRIAPIAANVPDMIRAVLPRFGSRQKVFAGMASDTQAGLERVMTALADGWLKPVVDRSYALADLGDAMAYVGTGRKRGAVVLKIG